MLFSSYNMHLPSRKAFRCGLYGIRPGTLLWLGIITCLLLSPISTSFRIHPIDGQESEITMLVKKVIKSMGKKNFQTTPTFNLKRCSIIQHLAVAKRLLRRVKRICLPCVKTLYINQSKSDDDLINIAWWKAAYKMIPSSNIHESHSPLLRCLAFFVVPKYEPM